MRKIESMTYYMLKRREPWKYEDRGLTKRKLSRLDDGDADEEGGES